jgi:hypothetical protein
LQLTPEICGVKPELRADAPVSERLSADNADKPGESIPPGLPFDHDV